MGNDLTQGCASPSGILLAKGIHPLINVSNLDKSLEFYKGIGLKTSKETAGDMTWGSVSSGDASLMLYPKAVLAPHQPADTHAWLSGDLGKGVVISVGVPNATKLFEKAKSFGATIDQPLNDAPWGGKEFMVNDPDGYVIAFQDKFPAGARKTKTPARSPTKKATKGAKSVKKSR